MPAQTVERKAYRKRYYEHEPQSFKEARKRWRKTLIGMRSRKNTHLKESYGITIEDYEAKQKCQQNRCAICDVPGERFKKGLHVDHNHRTGRVRGLLCVVCNTALQKLEDTQFVEKAKYYLQSWD